MLLLGHKDTLKEIAFVNVKLTTGQGDWQSMLGLVRDELSVKVLSMSYCMSGEQYVLCLDDDGSYMENFDLDGGTLQDWTAVINCIRVKTRIQMFRKGRMRAP